MKTTRQSSAKQNGIIHAKEAKCSKSNQFRRNTVAAGVSNGLDSFEEMTRAIVLHRTGRSFSYNLSSQCGEEVSKSCQRQKLKQRSCLNGNFVGSEDTDLYSTNCDVPARFSFDSRRQHIFVIGSKKSQSHTTKNTDSSANGYFRHCERAQAHRWTKISKRLSHPKKDKRDLNGNLKSDSESVTRCSKCNKICNHKSKVRSKEETINGDEKNGSDEAEPDKSIDHQEFCDHKEMFGEVPKVKTCDSESSHGFHSQPKSRLSIKCTSNPNIAAECDKTGVELSPPILEIDQVNNATRKKSSISTLSSQVSSGSRNSSISQRSLMSVTSSTSTSSLAEKIIEARARMPNRDTSILTEQKTGSTDSSDSLMLDNTPQSKRVSVHSEVSAGSVSLGISSNMADNDQSTPIFISNNQRGQENGGNSFQNGKASPRKHLPDMKPTEGENSAPIKPARKHIRRVFEA